MANWKEIGVVPDSEDEELDLDTHSLASSNEARREQQEPWGSNQGLNDVDGKQGVGWGQERNDDLHDTTPPKGKAATFTPQILGTTTHELGLSQLLVADDSVLPRSPSSSPRVFNVPRGLLEHDIDSDREGTGKAEAPNIPLEVPRLEDDISRSYVQITSSNESPLSSPPTSQNSSLNEANQPTSGGLQQPSSTNEFTSQRAASKAGGSLQTLARRSLRERNLIQLHPYLLEEEKFSRTLKARGMKPIRLTSSLDKAHPESRDSQYENAEDAEADARESQFIDVDMDMNDLSPPEGNFPLENQRDIEGEAHTPCSDDEFPDVDKLLEMPKTVRRGAESKRPRKSYSSNHKQLQRSKIRSQLPPNTYLNEASVKSFDIVISPPPTSSPSLPPPHDSRRSMHRAISVSSKEDATPPLLPDVQLNFQLPADLLTPVTSAAKPVTNNSLLITSDTDSVDPFASEPDSPSSASLDESAQIRKVVKKIRGVLPASHLRVDQPHHKPSVPSYTRNNSIDASPTKPLIRRGIAVPRTLGTRQNPPISDDGEIVFLSSDSDGDKNGIYPSGFTAEDDVGTNFDELLGYELQGFAEEEDAVDAMLPSHKRRSKNPDSQRHKRRRLGPRLPSSKGNRAKPRQPRITEHIEGPRKPYKPQKSRQEEYQAAFPTSRHNISSPSRDIIPSLSIIDITHLDGQKPDQLPQFIRIAARTASRRSGQGRQSPSKKFVRLANREDTLEAQSVLQKWKQGRILPKPPRNYRVGSANISRPPLHRITNNRQQNLPPPIQTRRHPPRIPSRQAGSPLTVRISRIKQISTNDFVNSNVPRTQDSTSTAVNIADQNHQRMPLGGPRLIRPGVRPAQLETHELEDTRWKPASGLVASKKSLDALYRTSRKHRPSPVNPQLGRFLSEFTVRPAARPRQNATGVVSDSIATTQNPTPKTFRRKNTLPRHIDVGAKKYRQPSEPLVLEVLSPQVWSAPNVDSKLQGLGKYGTQYPIHFDMLPLHPGTYFHDSTFIGGGLLADVLKGTRLQQNPTHSRTSFRLGNNNFQWGAWNETVSSEIGLCFDWVADQLLLQHPSGLNSPTLSPIAVVTFIIDYVQHHLYFLAPHQKDFLSRMADVFREFLTRFNGYDHTTHSEHTNRAGVLVRCVVLVFQLLQITRATIDQTSLSYELEDCIRTLACSAGRLLVSHGLDATRELYDDLQCLSFREHGIKNDQHVVQSWVILIKVLNVAQIQKGSFWDIANCVLIDVDLQHSSDARSFERLWYSMFSLLPLCEFDEFGIVKPGLRQKAAFDNWPYPQRILKRIFELYSLDPRQSPGFNDYCRTMLRRCHYLMTEWGWWKCTGIIGTVFDFFASHKLAHLRNEEVYSSPRFLMELDQQPSLAVEPRDYCFHIFLKIVGSAIKHMRGDQNSKAIRNLVARLLPNHDRQYPKEEAIHHRELASLRNHHDLLCTLYWAAPAEQRPSPSLIQDLVIADRSHNEACLINLRAWENITRFLVTASTDVSMYHPFTVWQNAFAASLSQQYLGTESELRGQAETLAVMAKDAISEKRLRDTIVANKNSTMEILRAIVKAMDHTVGAATSSQMAIQAFNPQLLSCVFLPDLFDNPGFGEGMLKSCIEVILHYMEKIDRLQPIPTPLDQTTCFIDGESQGSLDMNLSLDRVELIYRLQPEVLPLFRAITSKSLQDGSSVSHTVLCDIVSCWARLAIKLMEGAMNMKEFLISGPNALFQQRQRSNRAVAYWPLFLSELLEHKSLDDFRISGFDIGVEWLKALSMPQDQSPAVVDAVSDLTAKLQSKGYYLSISPRQPEPGARSSQIAFGIGGLPHILIKNAVDIMRATLLSQVNVNSAFGDVSQKEAHNMFAAMLRDVMDFIKFRLKSMAPGSEQHKEYVEFVQHIVCIIRSYGSNIQPLLEFFVHPSAFYWPEETDPNLFTAGIVSYALRLIKQPGRTAPELFHYLYNGWRKDLARGSVGQHVRYVKKGMSRWEFTFFLFSEFMPAALHVGFESPAGWVLCATYLPALAQRAGTLLQRRDTKADLTFQCVMNILNTILNGIITLRSSTGNISATGPTSRQYITYVVSQFWLSLVLPIHQYADPYPDKLATIRSLSMTLTKFIYDASQSRPIESGSDSSKMDQIQVHTGDNFERFVSVLTKDIHDHWEISNDGRELVIIDTRARETTKSRVDPKSLLGEPQTLRQMLDVASPYLESLVDEPLPMAMESSWSTNLLNKYF